MTGQAKLEVQGVTKVFGTGKDAVPALAEVTFSVDAGSFTAILGPSGCGKSTLFNIIAGLTAPTAGSVRIGGEDALLRPGLTGYMLQKDLLLPWKTIVDNVALGQTLQGIGRREARASAEGLMAHYGLVGFEHRRPHELSGGMRQRAALMRTWLTGRDLLLLDEPFGALDALTRLKLQMGLMDLAREGGKTILLVTHDVEEAILLSDEILVLSRRPGQVRRRFTVDLPRPRTPGMLAACGVCSLKAELMALLLGEEEPDK